MADGGLVGHLGLVLDRVENDLAEGHLEVGPEHLQPYGVVHGGVYAAIAETLASIGAHTAAAARDPGGGVVGLENHTSFLRVARTGSTITATARPRHAGRRVQLWSVVMRDERGRELASSTVRLLVVDPTSL
ncbi:MAG: PaaI family thioesterase [Candidatus Dormibacteria bacterium]